MIFSRRKQEGSESKRIKLINEFTRNMGVEICQNGQQIVKQSGNRHNFQSQNSQYYNLIQNSKRSRQHNPQMQKHNDQAFINHIKRLPCQPSQSPSSAPSLSSQDIENYQQQETDSEGQRAILEFKRQIQERFKLSVANKIYSFPKRVNSIEDLISSDEDSEEQNKLNEQDSQALRPVSKVQNDNRNSQKQKKQMRQKEKQKEKQKMKGFRKKQVYYVRQNSGKQTQQQQQISQLNNESKGLKTKKKVGKSKQKQKLSKQKWGQRQKKEDSFRQRQRDTNRSKRFNTEPDSYNYLQTLRAKNKR